MRLLSLGLGLAEDYLEQYFGDETMSLAKFIHYPPTPEGSAGVNAHHDTGFLTVLDPGPTAGLQVQNQAGQWIDVPSVEGSFVINLGETLQAMTGNYLVATAHRVITAGERYSAGYFHGPSLDVSLAPLPLDDRFAAAVAASPHHRNRWIHGQHCRNGERRGRYGQLPSPFHLRRATLELLLAQLPGQRRPPLRPDAHQRSAHRFRVGSGGGGGRLDGLVRLAALISGSGYGAAGSEVGDLIGAMADLGQDLVGVLPQGWGQAAG